MSKGNIKKVAINFKLDDKQEGDMWEYLNKVSTNHSAYFKRLLYMEMRLNPDGKGGSSCCGCSGSTTAATGRTRTRGRKAEL